MLPDNIWRQFQKFRRETGIRDPVLDMQLTPTLTLMKHTGKPASSFHFSFGSTMQPDVGWKYSTIGFIIPTKIQTPDWLGIDLGNDETWWVHDTEWDSNRSTGNFDNPFMKGFYQGFSGAGKSRQGARPHPGAQQEFFEGKWRFSSDRAKEDLKEGEKWVRAGKKFLAETLVDHTKDNRLLDQMKGYDDPED